MTQLQSDRQAKTSSQQSRALLYTAIYVPQIQQTLTSLLQGCTSLSGLAQFLFYVCESEKPTNQPNKISLPQVKQRH